MNGLKRTAQICTLALVLSSVSVDAEEEKYYGVSPAVTPTSVSLVDGTQLDISYSYNNEKWLASTHTGDRFWDKSYSMGSLRNIERLVQEEIREGENISLIGYSWYSREESAPNYVIEGVVIDNTIYFFGKNEPESDIK